MEDNLHASVLHMSFAFLVQHTRTLFLQSNFEFWQIYLTLNVKQLPHQALTVSSVFTIQTYAG